MKGRPPKAPETKVDQRRAQAAIVAPAAMVLPEIPPMPMTLAGREEAAEVWRTVCEGLPALAETDLLDVEIVVESIIAYREVTALIAQEGYMVEVWTEARDDDGRLVVDSDGCPTYEKRRIANPNASKLARLQKDYATVARYHLEQLGGSRMAKARLNLLKLAGGSQMLSIQQRANAIAEKDREAAAAAKKAATRKRAPAKKAAPQKKTPAKKTVARKTPPSKTTHRKGGSA